MPKRTDTVTRTLTLDDSPCGLCAITHPDETLHSCKEHMHYHVSALKDDAAIAFKASLSLIFAHIADIHMVMLNTLSNHYGHSVEEMLEVVRHDPDWENIYLHPTLKRMVYFEPVPEPVPAPVPVRIKRAKPVKAEEPIKAEEPVPVIIKRPRGRPKKSTT